MSDDRLTVPTDPSNLTVLADWLEGRLDDDQSRAVATAVEGDATLSRSVDWLQGFYARAAAVTMVAPPPLVRQTLDQHFQRWAAARSIMETPRTAVRATIAYDSRFDLQLAGVRGVASDEVRHLAYSSEQADLVLDIHPLSSGRVRIDGQVFPTAEDAAPIFEAVASGPGLRLRAIDGDDLGRFSLDDVPRTVTELRVDNGELSILAPLDLLATD